MGEEASGGDPESEDLSEIEDPLVKMEVEIARLEKELQYSAAEIANIRQRSARGKSDAIKFGASSISRKILPLIGNLEKAVSGFEDASSSTSHPKFEAFLDGARMALEGVWAALHSEGVTHVDAVGNIFDPTCMDAIATVSAPDGIEPGHVVEVVEEGYMLHERVLRAARVIVAEASVDEPSD